MKWHKGPPPEIGWWPASVSRDKKSIRWWDGECWSSNAWPHETAQQAAIFASIKQIGQYEIEWTERWWEEV